MLSCMKKPITRTALAALSAIVISFTGCTDSETVAPDSSREPAINRTNQYAADVEVFERAAGKNSGFTPQQIHEFMKGMQSAPVFKNKFLGIPTLQTPSDLWIIMEIMYETKPDIIVEAGTFQGGSAAFWAIILEHINPNGRVITIDIEDKRHRLATRLPISERKVDFLLGSSTDPAIVAEVHRRAKGKRVLVILDSLHSKDHVAAELKAYAQLVPIGGYIIVQDTQVGPLLAIDEFLAANSSFIADRSRERYSDTNTVRGYLKRVGP